MPTGAITPEEINARVSASWPTREPQLCTEVGPRHAIARRDVTSDLIRPGGFVSGPTQFALADAVLWYAVFGALGRYEPMALTSELSIRYLRPAQGATVWARADLDVVGRRQAVGTVRIWMDDQPDRLVSTAQGTYVLPLTG
jgi:uncharacterized protein (TIGR00369 family)